MLQLSFHSLADMSSYVWVRAFCFVWSGYSFEICCLCQSAGSWASQCFKDLSHAYFLFLVKLCVDRIDCKNVTDKQCRDKSLYYKEKCALKCDFCRKCYSQLFHSIFILFSGSALYIFYQIWTYCIKWRQQCCLCLWLKDVGKCDKWKKFLSREYEPLRLRLPTTANFVFMNNVSGFIPDSSRIWEHSVLINVVSVAVRTLIRNSSKTAEYDGGNIGKTRKVN